LNNSKLAKVAIFIQRLKTLQRHLSILKRLAGQPINFTPFRPFNKYEEVNISKKM